jgi:hypothetical protein
MVTKRKFFHFNFNKHLLPKERKKKLMRTKRMKKQCIETTKHRDTKTIYAMSQRIYNISNQNSSPEIITPSVSK